MWSNLVKIIFDTICINHFENKLDTDHITIIDNGDYQGTLLFVIPYDNYQPSECEHIMTYIDYGSCSGCDALEAIRYSETLVDDLMYICKDIVSNTIKPYNHGWRYSDMWEFVEVQTDEHK